MSRGSPIEIESRAFHHHLRTWTPFLQTLDPDPPTPPHAGPHTKRPCLTDRATSSFSVAAAALHMSRLSLFDDRPLPLPLPAARRRWLARKRRRRGSRSASGRSSAVGTCSDMPAAAAAGGTDSSGEMFGETNWASDVSDRNSRGGERENVSLGWGQFGNCESESGYGSEPGYRGDAELGYGDEEDDDSRALFWGDEVGDNASKLERVGENSLQKAHHRGRRKKHDVRMVEP